VKPVVLGGKVLSKTGFPRAGRTEDKPDVINASFTEVSYQPKHYYKKPPLG
jgi:hypothetical protein